MSLEISSSKIGVRNSTNIYKMHYTKLTLNCPLYLRTACGLLFLLILKLSVYHVQTDKKKGGGGFDSKHNFGGKIMCHFKVVNKRHKTGSEILNLK